MVGSQRIPHDHVMDYWQQANVETALAKPKEALSNVSHTIDRALYVGRIPTHFGHFWMEGFPRLCDAVTMDIPIIGYITDGFLPEGIKATPQKEIRWVIGAVTGAEFIEVGEKETIGVRTLFVPDLPIKLSHSCAEPWRMTAAIKKVVEKARMENPEVKDPWDHLYLMRLGEEIPDADGYALSDPASSISSQIARVSFSAKLMGVIGSSTHLSMFAPSMCHTNWLSRDNDQANRNQLICDLVRTYNEH